MVNYDGYKKTRSTIGEGAFIGCNSNLVSPVEIAPHGFVAAGSTITKDVPSDALAVARNKQRNIEGWVARKEGRAPARMPSKAGAGTAASSEESSPNKSAKKRPVKKSAKKKPAEKKAGKKKAAKKKAASKKSSTKTKAAATRKAAPKRARRS